MNRNFTSLLFFIFFAFTQFVSYGQAAGDYRSAATGDWQTLASWQTYDGVAWVPAVATPSFTDGQITIRSPHVIRLNGPVTADQLIIDLGGTLNINVFVSDPGPNNLTLNDGAGDDLTVNGTLLLRAFNRLIGPGNAVINGTFNFYAGYISAPVTTSASSITNFDLNFTKVISAAFINNGTLNWLTQAGFAPVNLTITGTTLTNNGTINEQFNDNVGFTNGGGGSFINNGLFNKTTTFTFANNSTPITNSATGIIQGLGTLSINFGTMTNNGTVSPGITIGALTMNAGTVGGQNTTLNIGLSNLTGPGTGNDVLDLSTTGAFNINLATVTLNISEIGIASLGSYTILRTNATGTFINNFANIGAIPVQYQIVVLPQSVVLNKISGPLPVVWGSFEAVAKNNKVFLNWTTLQEENTDYYLIEHSTDGRNFKQITTVKAAGKSASAQSYSHIHSTPDISSVNYYRIKLFDMDSKSSGSWIRPVRFSRGNAVALQVAPNPFTNNLQLTVHQENVHIKLTDANGRLMKSFNLQPGLHNIDVSSLSAGMYTVVVLRQNKIVQSQTIIKQ
jgi:hypothetical protein